MIFPMTANDRLAVDALAAVSAPGRGFQRPSIRRGMLRAFVLWVTLPLAAWATENGTTAFPNGAEDFLLADMPPPGLYGWMTYNQYTADRLADNAGHMALRSFDFTVNAVVPRLDWVKPASLLGSDRWGTLFIVPLLDLDLALSPVPGVTVKGRRRGWGDFVIGNGLHWTFPTFNMVNAIDVVFPTGGFDAMEPVNPGLNRWVLRLNHMGTWHPTPVWDVSYRLHWDYNFRNPDTDYHSGQTVYLNWAVGWKPSPPLTVGVAGYVLRQITDDRQAGQAVGPAGNRVRVDGIGPCVKYFLPNHVMLTVKYFRDCHARNHPEGSQVWAYVVVPLGPAPAAGH
jgi:hypothetical protein